MSRDSLAFIRYLIVGGFNTGFGYAGYAAFVLLGVPLWLAVVGSTILAVCVNFLSYGGVVFGNVSLRVLPRFLAFYAVLGVSNFALLQMLVGEGLAPLWAQAVLLPFLSIAGYFAMRRFVFGRTVLDSDLKN